MEPGQHRITARAEEAGGRLDRVLADHLGALSRARVKALIKDGRVRHAGVVVDAPNRRVAAGDTFEVDVPPAVSAVPLGEAIPLDTLYEDAHLIVVNKPAGLVVHPAAGNWTGTLVNALIAHCGDSLSGIGGVKRPGIVHRLDKDTSGVMVVAKTDRAHAGLAAQFAAHGKDGRMSRTYDAFVWGTPERPTGRVDALLGRAQGNRTKMAVVPRAQFSSRPDAREAVTRYATVATFDTATRAGAVAHVQCVLETGRTHQIRVHMAHIGHPLLGDATYGAGHAASAALLGDQARSALSALNRQALHARTLGFEHPLSGEAMVFDSPLPPDLAALKTALAAAS
ncbi:MAG: RluA family pseudouridine synthase [Pseudomonadota bacterium]